MAGFSPRAATLLTRMAGLSPLVAGVRNFVEQHVPEGDGLEERQMFGMAMWLVRGNMFLGVGLRSGRLLLRVGEENVEGILEAHPLGVERCGAASGRVFPGTVMVDQEHFRGDTLMAPWFDYAMAHNRTLCSKASAEKPRKKRPREAPPAADGDVAGEEATEAAAGEAAAGAGTARPRPSSTSGGAFARCVLDVIRRIPRGRVAAYGQVAALAGAPRNARQVGHMLKEGLCAGGAPWHRVLGASGKISLPASGGGDEQRRQLEAEGVVFQEGGAVAKGARWERSEPFYA